MSPSDDIKSIRNSLNNSNISMNEVKFLINDYRNTQIFFQIKDLSLKMNFQF